MTLRGNPMKMSMFMARGLGGIPVRTRTGLHFCSDINYFATFRSPNDVCNVRKKCFGGGPDSLPRAKNAASAQDKF